MSLINRQQVRQLALTEARNRWNSLPYGQRCSKSFLDRIEAQVRLLIHKEVYQHPSRGKTL